MDLNKQFSNAITISAITHGYYELPEVGRYFPEDLTGDGQTLQEALDDWLCLWAESLGDEYKALDEDAISACFRVWSERLVAAINPSEDLTVGWTVVATLDNRIMTALFTKRDKADG